MVFFHFPKVNQSLKLHRRSRKNDFLTIDYSLNGKYLPLLCPIPIDIEHDQYHNFLSKGRGEFNRSQPVR